MTPKNAQSQVSESPKAQPQAISTAPLLSSDREAVLSILNKVDVRWDGIPDGDTEKRMLAWTINEIRKTCANLPVDKLKKLVERIQKVMMERTIQQQQIETELSKQREQLKQEVDADQKKKYEATRTDRLLKYFQDHTSIRLFSKNKLDDIGNMKPNERAEFEKQLENNDDLLAKFIDGWQNDHVWREDVRKNHPESYEILGKTFDNLVKKYDIQIANGDLLSAVKKKVKEAKARQAEKMSEKSAMETLTKRISQGKIVPDMQKIITLTKDVDTFNPSIFGQITDAARDVRKTVADVRKSADYAALQNLAKSDPTLAERLRVFEYKLQQLDHAAWKLSQASFTDMLSKERRANLLMEISSKMKNAAHVIETGEMLVETYSEKEGNTTRTLQAMEAEIASQASLKGGAANVNAKGFSEYLTALYVHGKLNFEYLRSKGFLAQFALHWEIEKKSANSTKAQALLLQTKSGSEILKNFKQILAKEMDYSFNQESLRNGSAFAKVTQYMEKQGIQTAEAKEISGYLQKAKGNASGEMTAIITRLNVLKDSNNATISEIAKRALPGFKMMADMADMDLNGHKTETLSQFAGHLSSPTIRINLNNQINALANDKKNKSEFSAKVKIQDLLKHPEAIVATLKFLDNEMRSLSAHKGDKDKLKDYEKLERLSTYLSSKRAEKGVQAMKNELVVQNAVLNAAKKIGPSKSIQSATAKISQNPKEIDKLSKSLDETIAIRQRVEEDSQVAERAINQDAAMKILAELGFDSSITPETIKNDPSIAFEVLRRIGILDSNELKKLDPEKLAQLRQLQQLAAYYVGANLQVHQAHGVINKFNENNNSLLAENYSGLAAERRAFQENGVGTTEQSYLSALSANRGVAHSEHSAHAYSNAVEYDSKSLTNAAIGQPVRIDSGTYFVREADGSCSIKTPFSTEVIPPEKANIAVGYIRVAKQFDGLNLVGSLHETLQAHSGNPLLSKMKDGASKKEICALIRHFADVLGVEGYNQNADTPRALLTSVNNCLPFGKSFWELAHDRGLTKPDGTINPIAISRTFQVDQPKAGKGPVKMGKAKETVSA